MTPIIRLSFRRGIPHSAGIPHSTGIPNSVEIPNSARISHSTGMPEFCIPLEFRIPWNFVMRNLFPAECRNIRNSVFRGFLYSTKLCNAEFLYRRYGLFTEFRISYNAFCKIKILPEFILTTWDTLADTADDQSNLPQHKGF